MQERWKVFELNRYDRILLQISHDHEIVGTISLDESDMESRVLWKKAIEYINNQMNKEVEF